MPVWLGVGLMDLAELIIKSKLVVSFSKIFMTILSKITHLMLVELYELLHTN